MTSVQRKFLLLTAAINGAAIMVVEILGAKMLAPYLGTSHFVWTAQIGVAMASLAFGYFLGGRWADSAAHLNRLFGAMMVAAIYLCLATIGVRFVALKCLGFPLPVGSLVCSVFLFFIPLSLLALTGPFLVRFMTHRLQNVGGIVGSLSALSTVGSLAGTALIGYALIPLAPNSVTMFGTATVIALLSLIHFAIWGRRPWEGAVVAGIVVAVGGLGVWLDLQPRFARAKQLFRGNSNYGQLQVMETQDGALRLYLNDYLIQNTYAPATRQSVSVFTYALEGLARSHAKQLDSALCIGMGIGIVPTQLARTGTRVDVVEINPAVVPLAERYFDLDVSKFNLTVGDGRQFLNRCTNRYDAIILDAFLGDSSPSHLMTREAFSAMKAVMNTNGVLVINCISDASGGRDFLLSSLTKTLRDVFGHARLYLALNGNTFFVASPLPIQVHHKLNLNGVHPHVLEPLRQTLNRVHETDPNHGIVLTDDFNPSEFYDAGNRERLRRDLALGMESL